MCKKLRYILVLLPGFFPLIFAEDLKYGFVPELHGFRPRAQGSLVHVEDLDEHRHDHVL